MLFVKMSANLLIFIGKQLGLSNCNFIEVSWALLETLNLILFQALHEKYGPGVVFSFFILGWMSLSLVVGIIYL